MRFLEKDLEQIIFESDIEELSERGLHLPDGKKFRQLRIGNYGIADLVFVYMDRMYKLETPDRESYQALTVSINVFELKMEQLDFSALHQAISYLKGIESYITKRLYRLNCDVIYNKSITLIGKTINPQSSIIYCPDLFENIDIYTYDYKIDGIRFENKYNYFLTDEGFKIKNRR